MVHDPAVANTVEANAVNDPVADADKMKTVDDPIANAVEENAVCISPKTVRGVRQVGEATTSVGTTPPPAVTTTTPPAPSLVCMMVSVPAH